MSTHRQIASEEEVRRAISILSDTSNSRGATHYNTDGTLPEPPPDAFCRYDGDDGIKTCEGCGVTAVRFLNFINLKRGGYEESQQYFCASCDLRGRYPRTT
jgi:hypothetical protein